MTKRYTHVYKLFAKRNICIQNVRKINHLPFDNLDSPLLHVSDTTKEVFSLVFKRI